MNKENSVFLKMKKIQENGVNKKVRNFIEFQSKLYNEKGELIRIKSSKKMSAQNKKDEERIISKRKRVLSSDFFQLYLPISFQPNEKIFGLVVLTNDNF